MATIREWLDEEKFDWDKGTIIYQKIDAEEDYPGWEDPISAEKITSEHPILDYEFDDGYGAPECPRFLAKDESNIYFPSQYDGATFIVVVAIEPEYYLTPNHPTPYPGG
jgi:hypothetical protein